MPITDSQKKTVVREFVTYIEDENLPINNLSDLLRAEQKYRDEYLAQGDPD